MNTPPPISGSESWRKWLSIVAIVAAIFTPAYFYGRMSWLYHHPPRNQEGSPLIMIIVVSLLCTVLTASVATAAIVLNRRSPISWCAAILSLIDLCGAVFILFSLRNLHF